MRWVTALNSPVVPLSFWVFQMMGVTVSYGVLNPFACENNSANSAGVKVIEILLTVSATVRWFWLKLGMSIHPPRSTSHVWNMVVLSYIYIYIYIRAVSSCFFRGMQGSVIQLKHHQSRLGPDGRQDTQSRRGAQYTRCSGDVRVVGGTRPVRPGRASQIS